MKLILTLGVIVILAGCSVFGYKNSQNTIYIENTATIKYSGKGAGASFALMGAMGPMGAAIGAAIDEGISKDIRNNFENSSFDFVEYLCEQYRKQEVRCVSNADRAQKLLIIQSINLTSKGSQDLMQVSVGATIKSSKGKNENLIYRSGETKVTLDQAKERPGSIWTLFKGLKFKNREIVE